MTEYDKINDLRRYGHPMATFREIALSPVTTARVLPDSHRDRFGYRVDARSLVQAWDALEARADRAEAEVIELQAAIRILLERLT